MVLIPPSHHVALIRDCFPKELTTEPLPGPVPNALSKLTFYASSRPSKLPKVVAVVCARVWKELPAVSRPKHRAVLSICIGILTALAKSCQAELQAFAAEASAALHAVVQSVTEPEVVRHAAQLFRALSAARGPFVAVPSAERTEYEGALSILAQRPDVALDSAEAVVASERLYASDSAFENEVQSIVPVLFEPIVSSTVDDVREARSLLDKSEKAPSTQTVNDATSEKLAILSRALLAIRTLSRSAHGPQARIYFESVFSFLDARHKEVYTEKEDLVRWMAVSGASGTNDVRVAQFVPLWLDLALSKDATEAKKTTLVLAFSDILKSDLSSGGLSLSDLLRKLTLIVISASDSATGESPLVRSTISAFGLLPRNTSYPTQTDDLAAELVSHIQSAPDSAVLPLTEALKTLIGEPPVSPAALRSSLSLLSYPEPSVRAEISGLVKASLPSLTAFGSVEYPSFLSSPEMRFFDSFFKADPLQNAPELLEEVLSLPSAPILVSAVPYLRQSKAPSSSSSFSLLARTWHVVPDTPDETLPSRIASSSNALASATGWNSDALEKLFDAAPATRTLKNRTSAPRSLGILASNAQLLPPSRASSSSSPGGSLEGLNAIPSVSDLHAAALKSTSIAGSSIRSRSRHHHGRRSATPQQLLSSLRSRSHSLASNVSSITHLSVEKLDLPGDSPEESLSGTPSKALSTLSLSTLGIGTPPTLRTL